MAQSKLRKAAIGIGVITFLIVIFQKSDRTCMHREDAEIAGKALICGICRNVEQSAENSIALINDLGSRFSDHRVIIYENNSKDRTKEIFKKWKKNDPHLIFLSENVPKQRLKREMKMGKRNRTEQIARARNIVLEKALDPKYDDFTYVIWVDLDVTGWDVDTIAKAITHPERPWDAILASSPYDLFALRSSEFPLGFEHLGNLYWKHLQQVRDRYLVDENDSWKQVYSAFGGLGIYKREAIVGCRYSGTVTKELEKATEMWLTRARREKDVCFLPEYETLLTTVSPLEMQWGSRVDDREHHPEMLGIRYTPGRVVWFSCDQNTTLPWTCEHIPFHATMILNGHDQIFIHPKIRCTHP